MFRRAAKCPAFLAPSHVPSWARLLSKSLPWVTELIPSHHDVLYPVIPNSLYTDPGILIPCIHTQLLLTPYIQTQVLLTPCIRTQVPLTPCIKTQVPITPCIQTLTPHTDLDIPHFKRSTIISPYFLSSLCTSSLPTCYNDRVGIPGMCRSSRPLFDLISVKCNNKFDIVYLLSWYEHYTHGIYNTINLLNDYIFLL